MCQYNVNICVYIHVGVSMWRSEGNFPELALCLHHMGSEDGAQVTCFGDKSIYLLRQLTKPHFFLKIVMSVLKFFFQLFW